MEKKYNVRVYPIVINAFYALVGGVVLAWLSSMWLNGIMIYLVGVIVFILGVWSFVFSRLISIEINDDDFIVKKRGQVKHSFKISESAFEAHTRTSGTDADCKLTIISSEGFRKSIDCTLIGTTNFEKICEDLCIIGDNAYVQDLKTDKK